MDMKTAKEAERLRFAIIQQGFRVEAVGKALKECTQDETNLFWSAYGCLELRDGWGRKDVERLLAEEKAKLSSEKQLEVL